MKVEQRIGRIDRIGQQSQSIDIINLISKDTIEEQVYDRLYERLGIIRTALGDFEPILGDIIRDIEIALVNPELRSEEHTSELQSLMRISYAVFCLKKKKHSNNMLY